MKKRGAAFFGNYKVYAVAALLLLIACGQNSKNFMNDEPITTPPEENQTPPSEQTPAIPELEKFIFEADNFTKGVVPRELDPAEVAKFLIEKVEETIKLKPLKQVEKVAAFYDTYEVAEKFRSFLNRNEAGDDAVQRSIIFTRIIGRVGKPEEVEFAKRYYLHLVSKIDSLVEFDEIILLHDVLRLGRDSGALRAKIQEKLKSLEAIKESDDQARLKYLKLQEISNQTLTRAEKVEEVKEQILEINDRKKRLEEEIKAYLAIDYGFIEYLQPWAAARIRRETWANNPAEQTIRDEKPPLRADVVESFGSFYTNLDKVPDLDEEAKEAAKIQILRAIKFFGGQISEQEENFLKQFAGTQADILANEGFLLPREDLKSNYAL